VRKLGCLAAVLLIAVLLIAAWWVLRPDPSVPDAEPSPVVENPAPGPGRGLASEAPDAELLASARELLGDDAREDDCGPYALYTDVGDPRFVAVCTLLASRLDGLYAERYGVRPRGEPAEAIVLFAEIGDYRSFSKRQQIALGYAGYALGARGLAVFYAGDQSVDGFLPTLTHELTHLLSRRALGANLPRWLSEGLADGIGDSATSGGFRPLEKEAGNGLQATRLRTAMASGQVGSVRRLVGLQPSEFDHETPSFDYEQSALLVRFLLVVPELASGYRSFLGEMARGGSYDPDGLRRALGVSWEELDRRFAAWVVGPRGID
jgi:hypothetical protein